MTAEEIVDPFKEVLFEAWAQGRERLGTDDLLLVLDTVTGEVIVDERPAALPKVKAMMPPDVMERIAEAPGVGDGHFRSFWVIFNGPEGDGMGCVRLSVATDAKHHPN